MKRKGIKSSVDIPEEIIPDYNSDTSDEDHFNTIGNVPLEWYEDHDHIGYDLSGQKIKKVAKSDALETFLNDVDNPDAWLDRVNALFAGLIENRRSIVDKLTGSSVTLSDEDISLLKRAFQNKFPDDTYDPYEKDSVDFFTGTVEKFPLSSVPEPKRRFIPSKPEALRIMKIVRAIRKGLITPGVKPTEAPKFYDIWADSTESLDDRKMHIPPPRLPLPDHRESYNPPLEYLSTIQEDLENGLSFIPKKHSSLRLVKAYDRFINERFDRCLDLYLCPRLIKNRINVDPESLIPRMPSRRELEPYPSRCSIVYEGHTKRIRSIAFDPTGKWFISGSDDGTARCWEVLSGRLVKTWNVNSEVLSVSWNPNPDLAIVAIAALSASDIFFVIPPSSTESKRKSSAVIDEFSGDCCTWRDVTDDERKRGIVFAITLSSVGVIFSNNIKSKSLLPVSSGTGRVNILLRFALRLFWIFAAYTPAPTLTYLTQQGVRIYNLVKQELVNRLYPGVKWISSIDIHPKGDHIIMGSYDKKLCWFDLDLSPKPYKVMRYHTRAIRNVVFHRRFPLFASCSDDGTVNVFHSMIYADLDRNPLIVPLKSLKAHDVQDSLGTECEALCIRAELGEISTDLDTNLNHIRASFEKFYKSAGCLSRYFWT
ncbi:Ribosome biogenesis protein 1 [Dinochytrium kinnereticum]|nr:Ribosome biogenesis protein 1 [Dinochytrium kinnereticum]